MVNRLHHLYRDERGMSAIWVGAGFMAFLSATTLAIDVGMLMTARSQAQTSADAGALAGATALVYDSFTDHSANGPAVQSAITAAKSNKVIGSDVVVAPVDVEFLPDATGELNRVKVTVYRNAAHGNPMPALMGKFFGVPVLNVMATATAEAAPANAETCVKPFTIPDRWQENQDKAFDPVDSNFDVVDNKGKPLKKPDVYIRPDKPGATGWDANKDKGTKLILKANNQDKPAPSFYNPWDLPGSVGGNDYRDNIAGCNPAMIAAPTPLTPENGNMVGPTKQGVDLLTAKDPNAWWDGNCKCVKGSAFGNHSPRIGIIPLYDPFVYATGKQNGKTADLVAVNYMGFFIEKMQGNEVVGYITPVTGLIDGGGPAPAASFIKAIRLIQ